MSEATAVVMTEMLRVETEGRAVRQDALVRERPVIIEVNGREAGVLMALPGGEEELAAGFCLSEGIAREARDLLSVRACEPQPPARGPGEQEAEPQEPANWPVLVRVVVPVARWDPGRLGRPVVRYACGAVGQGGGPAELAPVSSELRVSAAALGQMRRELASAQSLFRLTGGTHAAAAFTAQGDLVVYREDVGRHNALDRVIGHCLRAGTPLADKVLLSTGRASVELAVKAVIARAPVLASLSAATAAAVRVAQHYGLTLIGFLRPGRMNIYTHSQRVP